ncbi:hypothetical protein CWB63_18770, partial [Pseudoalteromonas sp. S409]
MLLDKLLKISAIPFLLFVLSSCGRAIVAVPVNQYDPVEPEPTLLSLPAANGVNSTLDNGGV